LKGNSNKMGKNVIEIILDTSKSMEEEFFYLKDERKIDLAKEMLRNLLIEWGNYECNHLVFVRYLQNSKIVTMKKVNEIHKIESKEKLPIVQVIEESVNNLNDLGKEYKNRIIVLITDGKNSYDFDIKKIDSKIKIYTMEIGRGKNYKTRNQVLQSLSKETNGLSYSVLVENDTLEDMENMHSKIKKYFKCFKFPFFNLVSITSISLLMLFSYNNFQDKGIGCSSSNNKPIEYDSQNEHPGCASHNNDFTPQIEKKIKEDNSDINCTKKFINSIKLKKCTLKSENNISKSQKRVEAVIYSYPPYKIIALKNFASGKSDINKEYKQFLKKILKKLQIKGIASIKKIEIVGHTDLEKVKENAEHYFNKDCELRFHVKKDTNECLGKERAFQVKKIIDEVEEYKSIDINATYDNDFFMRNVDKKLGGTLLKALNLNENIDLIIKKLDIEEVIKKYSIEEIRKNKNIQQKIQNKRDRAEYREQFRPFRNVIILIEID